MSEVTITGLNRVGIQRPNKSGNTILAYFDCQTRGFVLQGCAFVRTSRHGLTVWPPKMEGPVDGARRGIRYAEERLRHQMTVAAQAAYRALGGTDGEWIAWDGQPSDGSDLSHVRPGAVEPSPP